MRYHGSFLHAGPPVSGSMLILCIEYSFTDIVFRSMTNITVREFVSFPYVLLVVHNLTCLASWNGAKNGAVSLYFSWQSRQSTIIPRSLRSPDQVALSANVGFPQSPLGPQYPHLHISKGGTSPYRLHCAHGDIAGIPVPAVVGVIDHAPGKHRYILLSGIWKDLCCWNGMYHRFLLTCPYLRCASRSCLSCCGTFRMYIPLSVVFPLYCWSHPAYEKVMSFPCPT